jgi:hypothetical protein
MRGGFAGMSKMPENPRQEETAMKWGNFSLSRIPERVIPEARRCWETALTNASWI